MKAASERRKTRHFPLTPNSLALMSLEKKRSQFSTSHSSLKEPLHSKGGTQRKQTLPEMGDPIPAHPTNAAMEELRAMVQTLAAEVQRLHAEVEDERKQRIYAVAALNQKMGKVLRRTSGGGGGSGGVASQEGDSPSSSRRGSSASNTAVAEAGTQQRDDASHSSQTPAPVKSALKKQKDPNVAALDPPQPAAAVVVADPKEEHLGVGSPVDVRCVSVLDNETEAKWDAARIMHVEGKGLYTGMWFFCFLNDCYFTKNSDL